MRIRIPRGQSGPCSLRMEKSFFFRREKETRWNTSVKSLNHLHCPEIAKGPFSLLPPPMRPRPGQRSSPLCWSSGIPSPTPAQGMAQGMSVVLEVFLVTSKSKACGKCKQWVTPLKTKMYTSRVPAVGWMVAPQKICRTEACECDHIERRTFTDAIKLRISRWYHPGLPGLALSSMTNILIRQETSRKRQRTRPCEVKGRDWSSQPQAQDCQQPSEGRRGVERILPRILQKKLTLLMLSLDFWPHELRKITFLLF